MEHYPFTKRLVLRPAPHPCRRLVQSWAGRSHGWDGGREVQAQPGSGVLPLPGDAVLIVLLAAAAHDDQVPAVGDDRRARPATFRADEEPAGRPEAEDRDHRLVQLVLR